jgi:hypothetical protein
MEEKILCSMNGVGWYGVVSILIFVSFFTGVLIWAFSKNRSYLEKMGGLPLDSGEHEANQKPNADQL